ncbi:MAG: hypothetical protein E7233_12900 [Lachnospiraceae bacterium]|nr:hypothetical protein [Lachnospiraceae bacterium]
MAKIDLTEKENFMMAYNHGIPAWVPNFEDAYCPLPGSCINNKGVPGVGGPDMFGTKWICTKETEWMATPDPKAPPVLEDITEWKDVIHFPKMSEMDWEGAAARDLAYADRTKMISVSGMEGNYNRLGALMGTTEALMAMIEEPEAVYEWFDAYTNFKCEHIKMYAKYYKPDIYINPDDICFNAGCMFSRKTYEELIKPFEMRLGQTAIDCGMIVEHHLCGKCEDLIPDILETGATIWQTAQPSNDLLMIKEKYGDRLLINGGWNSIGPHNFADVTEEVLRQEVRNMLDKYAKDGNYSLFQVIIGDPSDPRTNLRHFWVRDECKKYSMQMYGTI